MKERLAIVAIVVAVTLSDGPAAAEHMTLVAPSTETRDAPATGSTPTLDIDLKVGSREFRIGGRLFGPGGVAGAWLNGQVRRDGFSLDGRVQGDSGRAYNFRLDADVMDWITRAGWQRLLGTIAD
jgi:hypothetical protein